MSEKQIEEEAVKPPQPEQQDADDDEIGRASCRERV